MLLKPFTEDTQEITVIPPSKSPDGIMSILSESGIESDYEEELNPEQHIQHLLKSNGAGLDSAAKHLGQLMASADTDSARLGAIKTALELHGVLKKDNEIPQTMPAINITIIGSGNKTLINVLTPTP